MERCTSCGWALPDAAQFCGYCGRAVITIREMPTHMSGNPVMNAREGDTVASVLRYVDFDMQNLLSSFKKKLDDANLTAIESAEFLDDLTVGLNGYTYFEE